MSLLNAITVDVEDYFQVSAFEMHIARRDWGQFPSRVEANTRRVLELFARHNVQATFFILGWTAERYPGLVREIRQAGHEIGSHSYWHRLVYGLTPQEFREDLCRSRDVIEEILGEPVTSYRAPSFSITRHSWWALEILREEGFDRDSSVYPTYHDRYGVPDANVNIHRIATQAGTLIEYPLSVVEFSRYRLPVSGGGYFRLYPWIWTRYCLERINRRAKRPFVFYFHPWELDPEQPRLQGSLTSRFRHYVNLPKTERKLTALLERFPVGPLSEC